MNRIATTTKFQTTEEPLIPVNHIKIEGDANSDSDESCPHDESTNPDIPNPGHTTDLGSFLQVQLDEEEETEKSDHREVTNKRRPSKQVQRQQTASNPYRCEICCKTFCGQAKLERHALIHSGEKPFVCSECGKGFTQRGNMNRHLLSHTGGDERRYSCEVCGNVFAAKHTLNRHVRIHTGLRPFFCLECDKTFTESDTLSRHMFVHTRDRKYACNVCGKAFAEGHGLNRHVLTHSEQKNYCCAVCQKTFSQRVHLNTHMVVHNGEARLGRKAKKSNVRGVNGAQGQTQARPDS